jgi:DNA processing protein
MTNNWNMAERMARIAWSTIAEPGDPYVDSWCTEEGGYSQGIKALAEYQGKAHHVLRWQAQMETSLVPRVTRLLAEHQIGTLIPGDVYWPRRIGDLGGNAPWILYFRGAPEMLDEDKIVAVIGARAATAYGEHVSRTWSQEFARQNVAVISGGAYGIEAAAHRGALDEHGATISVMAGGLDRLYPSGNQDLLGTVAYEGLMVSEMPPGYAPTKSRFLARNRLIAALSDVMLVVEAGHRSGSLNAAHHAIVLDRMLCAVPGPITSAASGGSNDLIAEGVARLVATSGDVIKLGGW